MKRENQIGYRVSFPSSFFMELEDCWKHEAGAHRALTFQGFLNMMVGFGLEAYKAKTFPAPMEDPATDGEPDPADDEAWDFPRSNRRPLLRFPEEWEARQG
ncbi:hypothetical protein FACS1894137_16780 [Spirochaetia bacterium]|nr:hypothetical protein FACS1894137_16780 [Spirochaetia bacterium]